MSLGADITQLYVFLLFFVVGVTLTILYLTGYELTKRAAVAAVVFDVLFGLASVYVVWKINLVKNNGEARPYVFFGLAAGIFVATKVFKTPLDKLAGRLYNLFTEINKRQKDGTTVLQKVNLDSDNSGNTGVGGVAVRASDVAHAVHVNVRSRKRAGNLGRGSSKGKRRYARADRLRKQ